MKNPEIQAIVREDLAKATKATYPFIYQQVKTRAGRKKNGG